MQQDITTHTFPNGLTLLAERMPHVRSAAFNFLIPVGAVDDPPDRLGLTSVLIEMISRGAGERDSRSLSEALDVLGVDRSESAGRTTCHFSGVMLARNLAPSLTLYADILRRPLLPDDDLEAAKALASQEIQSLEDDPQTYVMVELARRNYPDPLGRDRRGTLPGVESITETDLRNYHSRFFQPDGAVLAVAGDIEWKALKDEVDRLFGDWPRKAREPLVVGTQRLGSGQIEKDIEQTQLALAYPSVPFADPEFYNARGAVGVLSQDMSSRLFTNIREKHGLCYSIYASHESFKDRASIICYAGSRPELAQQTLDLTLQELTRLSEGIEEDELDRVKVGLKAALIMRQESTSARAGSLTADWYHLNRVRPLTEIQAAVDGLTTRGILDHLKKYPAKDFTIVTLGPKPLTFPTA